jgi:glycine/D-amino acid oxidase-like deaminating enzyme
MRNNSNPVGPTGWFQGDPDDVPAWSGEPDSYVSADADSASGKFPVLSNWLITPEIDFGPNQFGAHFFGFYVRALAGGVNRIVVRLCVEEPGTACVAPGPESGDLGGFQTVLADINPDQTEQGFPLDWTGYDLAPADGLPVIGRGRIAFHYYAFWQPTVPLGCVIGIVEVAMAGATACPFTETVFVSTFD